jgi:hypothetical protein
MAGGGTGEHFLPTRLVSLFRARRWRRQTDAFASEVSLRTHERDGVDGPCMHSPAHTEGRLAAQIAAR